MRWGCVSVGVGIYGGRMLSHPASMVTAGSSLLVETWFGALLLSYLRCSEDKRI